MKYFILMNLILFTYLSLFLNDLLIIWFYIEIINFLFTFILNISMNNKKMIFLHIIIQILSSFLMIYSIILNNLFLCYNNYYIYFNLIIALLIKLSIPPFHFWLPLISSYLPCNILFIMITLQKIAPFYMLPFIKLFSSIFIFLILILSSIIPPFMTLNLTNFKMIMAYSSINQSSWMILLIYLKKIVWLQYFMLYSFVILNFIIIIYFHKMFKNTNLIYNKLNFFNLWFLTLMFNIAGLPPLSMFFMKWYAIFLFMKSLNLLPILILMMISSLFMMFIYMNMLINSLYFYEMESKLIKFSPNFMNLTIFNFFLSYFMSIFILLI
uniref:NADH dehydrogenase subunit 2 n=1 Tax=Mycetophylax simplex TaxID=341688 RepID=UPI0030014BE2